MQDSVSSTVTLLYDLTEKIPENIEVLHAVLKATAEKNSTSRVFHPADEQCVVCGVSLGPLEHVPGSDGKAFFVDQNETYAS